MESIEKKIELAISKPLSFEATDMESVQPPCA